MVVLTNYEKKLLKGEYGQEAKQLLEILLKVAEINGVSEFAEVEHVMIGNTCMLSVAGETGINFLGKLANSGVKFKVPTYTNVVSMDLDGWQELGISNNYAETQFKGVEAWKKLGAILNCSCMPFFSGAMPKYGAHVAYADTATVIFANSYFGAKSNRESDMVCLASAVTGRVPNFGYHLDKTRKGQFLIEVNASLKNESDYGALGYYIGKFVKEKVPVFKSFNNPNVSNLIQLGSSLASTGTTSLFHWVGVTPEIRQNPDYYLDESQIIETISVADKDLTDIYKQLNTLQHSQVDLVYIGCPHCDIEKIKHISSLLEGKRISDSVELWISAPSSVKHLASKSGDLQEIERAGGKILSDTCAVILPIKSYNFGNVVTDSAKAQVYLSDFGLNTAFGSIKQCLKAATSGRWDE